MAYDVRHKVSFKDLTTLYKLDLPQYGFIGQSIFHKISVYMNGLSFRGLMLCTITISSIILFTTSLITEQEQQAFARCPNGYHKSPSGDCEKAVELPNDLPRCPNGYHRSPDGDCERVAGASTESGSNADDRNTDVGNNNEDSSNSNNIQQYIVNISSQQ
jgi:hypothetical protein